MISASDSKATPPKGSVSRACVTVSGTSIPSRVSVAATARGSRPGDTCGSGAGRPSSATGTPQQLPELSGRSREEDRRPWPDSGACTKPLGFVGIEVVTRPPYYVDRCVQQRGCANDAPGMPGGRAYASREGDLAFLRVIPGYDPIRADPRFDDLVRRIGIPET